MEYLEAPKTTLPPEDMEYLEAPKTTLPPEDMETEVKVEVPGTFKADL